MVVMEAIDLGYDHDVPEWRRPLLRTIGNFEIRYGDHGPISVGAWHIDYDPRTAHRLGRVADRQVRYRIWLGQVKRIGDWRVRYGPLLPFFPWPCKIGPFTIERRGPWLRPSRVGPATLRYKPHESRPNQLVLDPPGSELTDDLLFAVAFVLIDGLWGTETSA